jgi:sulfoxide reductase catalytic subunit YedY
MGLEVKQMLKINPSEITPEDVYINRRQFMKLGALALGASVLAGCMPSSGTETSVTSTANGIEAASQTEAVPEDLAAEQTSFEDITNYNNYYEFTTNKELVASLSEDFVTNPWTIEVGGMVNKPGTFGIEDILQKFPREERIYRLRCVEAWSMVIPWLGFPLSKLLEEVEPTSDAKYVRFETLLDPEQMPGQRDGWFEWPYVEGLRLDEAMHDLTILSTGLYGKELLPQNGAPLRLVVPWKYGFKSIKSIVRIDLVSEMPTSLWMAASPNEYGFYANVNPEVNHPRWSQASERRIGETGRRPTLMFNGYEEEVAKLYAGMDLRANY